ncbi:MAG: hypothetical protein KF796_01350 [Ramlibacter sp.]|nr:hypothetical protein [Ramlibacter sp.]
MTTQMAFVEMPAAEFAEALFVWKDEITKMWESSWQVKKQFIQGTLASKLDALLPLTSVRSSKDLVSGTKSSWAAYIPNGFRGGDAHSAPSYLAGKLKIRTLTVILVDDVPAGQPGSVQFVLRDGRRATEKVTRHGIMYECPTRSVVAHKEGRWEFGEHGDRLAFEEVEKYQARKIKDRLTFEMVERYCGQLGIELFDPDFYAGAGYIIQSCPPPNAVFYPKYPNEK